MTAMRRPPATPHAPSHGFAPIAGHSATTLILGTLPGQMSLARQQYYGLPHNVFWKLMGDLFGTTADAPYALRTRSLIDHDIALWDVCASATRPGSLDSDIAPASIVANDFVGFFAAHTAVTRVFFNGAKAADLYRRLVLPSLPASPQAIAYETLPSTSPAHAGMPYAEKLARWSVVRGQA